MRSKPVLSSAIRTVFLTMLLAGTAAVQTYAQLDTRHYMPPMSYMGTPSDAHIDEHYMVLSTPATNAVDVWVRTADESFSTNITISKTAPAQVSLGTLNGTSTTAIENSYVGIVDKARINTVVTNEGLIASADAAFLFSITHKSTAQGAIIASKGEVALGTEFYTGHMQTGTPTGNNAALIRDQKCHFISVMATENNTLVRFENGNGYAFSNSDGTLTDGSPIEVLLQAGQTYTIGRHQADSTANYNDINGTHVTANKAIAVNSGSWNGGYAANSRDIGADQTVPIETVGSRYICLEGKGVTAAEKIILVATASNTTVRVHGDTENEITLAAPGDYTHLNGSYYSSEGIAYVETDTETPIYVWQQIHGSSDDTTSGMYFIPRLTCAADTNSVVAFDSYTSLFDSAVVNLSAGADEDVYLYGADGTAWNITQDTDVSSYRFSVPGNSHWIAYSIPEATIDSHLGAGNTRIIEIDSQHAVNVAISVESGYCGAGGYFSGFGAAPEMEASLLDGFEGSDTAAGSAALTAHNYDSYIWYYAAEPDGDFEALSGVTNALYVPADAGYYYVQGVKSCEPGVDSLSFYTSETVELLPALRLSAVETSGAEGENAPFQVSLSQPWHETVTVRYLADTAAGAAVEGSDFQDASGKITLTAGKTNAVFSVSTVDDSIYEPDELFELKLAQSENSGIILTTNAAYTIVDNDALPILSVETDIQVWEDVGYIYPQVTLDTRSELDVTASWRLVDGTAAFGSDYTASTGTITIAASQTETVLPIQIIDDALYESGEPETFTIELYNLQQAAAGTTNGSVEIGDNEDAPELYVADVTVSEGDPMQFTAVLSAASTVDTTFTVETELLSGDYTAGAADFSQLDPVQITLPAGDTSVDLPLITTTDDDTYEGDDAWESFRLTISAISNAVYTTPSESYASGHILDDDDKPVMAVTLTESSVMEGETLEFTAWLSCASEVELSCDYATVPGTAGSSDYTHTSGTLTFGAYELSKTIYVATIDDTEEEDTETFSIGFSNFSADLLAISTSAAGTIEDNDSAPTAVDDEHYSVLEDAALKGSSVFANDTAGDGDIALVSNTDPGGTFSMNSDGTFTYTPPTNFNGTASFSYTIEDDDGDQSSAEVTITVIAVHDPMSLADDSYTTDEDVPVSGNVFTNDTVADLPAAVALRTEPSYGEVSLAADGAFTYTPDTNYYGSDLFIYEVTDADGSEAAGLVEITINAIEDGAPVANNDTAFCSRNSSVVVQVLLNDTDPDGDDAIDIASVIIAASPTNGSVSVNYAAGTVTYTPDSDYAGTDSFAYNIADDTGSRSDDATVFITINADNHAPVAIAQDFIVDLDENGAGTASAADADNGSYDPDDDALTFSLSVTNFGPSDVGSVRAAFYAYDELGAVDSTNITITVRDLIAPVPVTALLEVTATNDVGKSTTTVTYTTPTFTDNVDGRNLVGTRQSGYSSGSSFPIGITTNSFTYTDSSGNESTNALVIVTVEEDPDTTFIFTGTPDLVTGGSLNAQHEISYQEIQSAAALRNLLKDSVEYRIVETLSGTTTIDGAAVTAGRGTGSSIGTFDQFEWTPPADEYGVFDAFSICAVNGEGETLNLVTCQVAVVQGQTQTVSRVEDGAFMMEFTDLPTAGQSNRLIFADAPAFSSALASWTVGGTARGTLYDGTLDSSLSDTNLRFYVTAPVRAWEELELAAEQVYSVRRIRLQPGRNWVAFTGDPDDTSLSVAIPTNSLPAGEYPSATTIITWYSAGTDWNATQEVYLASSGWKYALPTAKAGQSADALALPREQAVIMEIPEDAAETSFYFASRVPASTISRTLIGRGSGLRDETYTFITFNYPGRFGPADLGLEDVFKTGTYWSSSDLLWKWDRDGQQMGPMIWYSDSAWRFVASGEVVPDNYFDPDDGVLLNLRSFENQNLSFPWANKIAE